MKLFKKNTQGYIVTYNDSVVSLNTNGEPLLAIKEAAIFPNYEAARNAKRKIARRLAEEDVYEIYGSEISEDSKGERKNMQIEYYEEINIVRLV